MLGRSESATLVEEGKCNRVLGSGAGARGVH